MVELHIGGLSLVEVGRWLSLPLRTVEREFYVARLWLRNELG